MTVDQLIDILTSLKVKKEINGDSLIYKVDNHILKEVVIDHNDGKIIIT